MDMSDTALISKYLNDNKVLCETISTQNVSKREILTGCREHTGDTAQQFQG